MKRNPASTMALGGVLAALAVVVMAMGTLIPVATYVCPMICMLLLQAVLSFCGRRTAWTWFVAVCILSALLASDKEAVVVFIALGYYPILKPWMDKRKGSIFWKTVFFNTVILLAYWFMLRILGLEEVMKDLDDSGAAFTVILLLLGNLIFYLLDRVLTMGLGKLRRRK